MFDGTKNDSGDDVADVVVGASDTGGQWLTSTWNWCCVVSNTSKITVTLGSSVRPTRKAAYAVHWWLPKITPKDANGIMLDRLPRGDMLKFANKTIRQYAAEFW